MNNDFTQIKTLVDTQRQNVNNHPAYVANRMAMSRGVLDRLLQSDSRPPNIKQIGRGLFLFGCLIIVDDDGAPDRVLVYRADR